MKSGASKRLGLALAISAGTHAAGAASLDDIQFWAGSGNHRAALVIDWHDSRGPESLVWGYRWDGTATGMDMLQAVIAADARLYGHFSDFSWGRATLGIGYDLNHSGAFAVDPALTFDAGGIALDSGSANASDLRVAADPADHYVEGWNSGFWAYYLKSGGADAWTSAATGPSDRVLQDGMWDGYSFAPGFAGVAPGDPVVAAVPEPAVVTLLSVGMFATWLTCRARRRHGERSAG